VGHLDAPSIGDLIVTTKNLDAGLPSPDAEPRSKKYGFLIDQGACIGCHACSTACKSENEVPLGVYRTWVKTTETGAYPDTQRHFQVTRCNHCDNPPCVRICPTSAMYQRDDGIVEFNSDACIGCKACMQACPYDAIHIDPNLGTASKCHFCSHRTDIGLEPACVVVCPEHAILAGDLNDPTSEIAQTVARSKVTVRKPEQGTAPKLFYVEGSAVNLHPTATPRTPETFATADVLPLASGAEVSYPTAQGLPEAGPIQIGGNRAEHMVQVGYNAQHKVPWHWPVPAYLVTKGLGAGVPLLLALADLSGEIAISHSEMLVGGLFSLVMLGLTTALLVADLEKPERFLYILARPNWDSWLARGAVFLIGLTGVVAASTGLALLGVDALRTPLALLTVPLAIGAAIYTAFLFGQAEGRDLWQSPLLPPHLLLQAVMMGSGSLVVFNTVPSLLSPELSIVVHWLFLGTLVVDLFVILLGEFGMPHASEVAARAAHDITHGRYRVLFWGGAIVLGHVVPLALALVPGGAIPAVFCAVAGLYAFEYAFVMAPQDVPNS
jgi:Fe-S-cluster-containing dehydrogenase component/formate-dependent nitrite reductase membrane component NrfD